MTHSPLSLLFYTDRIKELPPVVVAITFFGPIILGTVIYLYFTRHARSWRKGIFPAGLKPNEDNFLEAYLALGARLILLDHQSMKGKTRFMNEYFNRYFRMANYNFGDSLVFSLRYPIRTETVTDWIKKHWKTDSMRTQVVYFLVGLALHTGKVSTREMNFLKTVTGDLGLSPAELQRIIAIYAAYNSEQKKTEKQAARPTTASNQQHYYLEILGVQAGAGKDEIKKAYRRLAKIHHPDNYAMASEAQQKIAEEKFIQIQKAYEYLLDRP